MIKLKVAIMAGLDANFYTRLETSYRNMLLSDTRPRSGQNSPRAAIEREHRHISSQMSQRWAIGRENNINSLMEFWVNPKSCSWSVGRRSSIVKSSGGAINYEIQQIDRPSNTKLAEFTKFDQPILNITFQSGNIIPGRTNDINNNISDIVPYGLANFFDFLTILDQSNITNQGTPNYVNIMYVSQTFGADGIWLRGFFQDDGISWSESAEDPGMIQEWTASFMVCHSNPALNNLLKHYSAPRE